MAEDNIRNIKIRLLDVVTHLFTDNLYVIQLMLILIVDVVFLVEYGFGDPTLIDNSIVIYKKNFTRNNIKYYSRNCGIYKNKFIHHKSLYS